ncbi:MAG: STAS domain-containing protein [Giesbergeria sp.]|uniref:STAS domain-containing protein n=1 Tax=Giesbergeria sp. TaxID=2818473 RepID=UPI00262CE5D4|nr:STAS domain-containing protein [Giesbergeria sp.]MDD2609266.1 STAS domain-containing protein [Giesbergeria sp.]
MPTSAEEVQAAPALALPAELTHRQAAAILAGLQQTLAQQTQAVCVLDASALAQFDSAALAVLLECRRTLLAQGRTLQVQGLPEALGRMALLYGVDGLLGLAVPSR